MFINTKEGIKDMKKLIFLVLSIVTGYILSLSIPNIEIGIIPFIALIPIIYIIKHTRTLKGAFLLGWLTGFILLVFGFNWLIHTITTFKGPSIPDFLIYPIFILFCLVFSLKFALINLFTKILDKNLPKLPIILTFPIVFTAIEFIYPELFPFYIGNLAYKNIFLLQITDITGISGITFIIVLINALLYTIIAYLINRFSKISFLKSEKLNVVFTIISIALVILIHIYGFIRINQIEKLEKENKTIKIGFIQPNTPMPLEEFKNNPDYLDRLSNDTREDYAKRKAIQLTLSILRNNPDTDLIIWPESSVPNLFYKEPRTANEFKFKSTIIDMTKGNGIPGLEKKGVYFFINDYDLEKIQKNGEIITKIYNNNDLISPDGELVDSYRKVFLLAFGEYNPFKDTFIEKIIPGTDTFMEGSGISNVTAGNEIKLMEMGKWKFAPQICYEIIIPHFTRLFTNLGSDFIVNSTNDRWFGKSKASKQHLLLGLPRAIENRNYIVRATNSGISTVISATGKIKRFSSHKGEVMFSPLYKQDYMVAEITPININTFYKSHGDYFAYLVLSLFILFIIYIVWMKFYIKFIKKID